MASRMTKLTRGLAVALVAPALLASPAAFAQSAYGPYRVQAPAHPGRGWRDGACGQSESVRAPDIMTYDRKTQSEVLVGHGPGEPTQVTGLNRDTGSAYSVRSDLTGPETPSVCTANAVTGDAYSIHGDGDTTVVRGLDGATRRSFEVVQGPGGHGPDFKSRDPYTGRSTEVITAPDGRPIVREFGPHALACTRARLGLGGKAEIGDLSAGAKGGVSLSLGDC